MTTTLKGQPPSAEVRAQLAVAGRPVMLAFSRGKDSIAAWLALRDAGVDVRPFFLYLIPGRPGEGGGLPFEAADLERWEATFKVPILRAPHPGLYRWLRNLTFQPPDRWRSILAADLARDSIYGKGTSTVRSTGPGDLFSLLKDTPRAAGAGKARTAAS